MAIKRARDALCLYQARRARPRAELPKEPLPPPGKSNRSGVTLGLPEMRNQPNKVRRKWKTKKETRLESSCEWSKLIKVARYANADYRIFDYAPDASPEDPRLVEWALTADNGGGMGTSEKGRAEVEARDFPPEDKTKEVSDKLGDKTDGEAVREVPK